MPDQPSEHHDLPAMMGIVRDRAGEEARGVGFEFFGSWVAPARQALSGTFSTKSALMRSLEA
jgi:hypothetical protein